MVLLRSTSFIRAAKKYISKYPQAAADIRDALQLLANDLSHPRLKTHKLKGDLKGSLACSAGFDCRIVKGKTEMSFVLGFVDQAALPLPGNVVRNQIDPVNKYNNSCTASDRGLTFRASGRVVACLGY